VPDGLDDITAAAIAIPGMSSWAALKDRAKFVAGETVLVNGATGTAGRLAVQIAKYLGAKKVIATGRNAVALQSLKALGADLTILLVENYVALEDAFKEQFVGGVDVVLDYLWGQSAERLLIAGGKAGKDTPTRFIQIGTASGANITLPGAILRSSAIELMGSGLGSVPLDRILRAIEKLLQAVVPGRFEIATKPVPLSEVEQAWSCADASGHAVAEPAIALINSRRRIAFPKAQDCARLNLQDAITAGIYAWRNGGVKNPFCNAKIFGRSCRLRVIRYRCAWCPAWHDVRSTPKADMRLQRNI